MVRKKYVALLPEEWVRQHCLHFLVRDKGYPPGRVLVERKLEVHGLTKRLDLAVCDAHGRIEVLVECKAPDVVINQEVFDQIARYNMEARARYLMVSNGLQHIFCQMDYQQQRYVFLEDLPAHRAERKG
ncbi:MAG TPA: type I restriction enzyme HsdR N-terminal domain-containing protein [Robiginitalea sp.]|nr:type I restriction enzyme HsdR N-terminal domain-containing protein [Robiginitalea sp.]